MKFPPQRLADSYVLAIMVLRLTGIFPYEFNNATGRFKFSGKFFVITIINVVVYFYVNITLAFEDYQSYLQPIFSDSQYAIYGNLVNRLLGILITLLIFAPVVGGSKRFLYTLGLFVNIAHLMEAMHMDVQFLYKKVFYCSAFATILTIIFLGFNSWHAVFFYEQFMKQPPELKYYVVVLLSSYYKCMFLFYILNQIYTTLVLSQMMNKFLEARTEEQKKRFKDQHGIVKYPKEWSEAIKCG